MKMSIAALGAALVVVGWAGTAAAESYNLICTGAMTRNYRYHRPGDEPRPFAITLRIDTDKQLFCADDCSKTEPLVSVSGQTIQLRSAKLTPAMEGFADSFAIEDGKLARYAFYPTAPHGLDHEYSLDEYKGTCKRAPFTGLKG